MPENSSLTGYRLQQDKGATMSIFGTKIPSGKASAKAKRQRPEWLQQNRRKGKRSQPGKKMLGQVIMGVTGHLPGIGSYSEWQRELQEYLSRED